MNKQVFNAKVASKSRDYFFDIRQSQNGDYYLVINQAKKLDEGYERQSIIVFKNLLTDFSAAFIQSMQKLSELDSDIVWEPHSVPSSNQLKDFDTEAKPSAQGKSKQYRELSDAEIEQKQMLNVRNGKPLNSGLRWSIEDRQRVKKFFLRGEDINSIAITLERSNHSINAELKKQGLILDESNSSEDRPF